MEAIGVGIGVVVTGVILLWAALIVISIKGWIFHRNDPRPAEDPHHREELEELLKSSMPDMDGEPSTPHSDGLTWRDPWIWLFVFICWPLLLTESLNEHWQRWWQDSK